MTTIVPASVKKVVKSKWFLIAIAASVVIVLLVVFGNKITTWLKTSYNTVPGDIQVDKDGNIVEVKNPLTEDEKIKIQDLATRLKDNIRGLNLFRDTAAFYELEQSSDRVFIGVANVYKQSTGASLFADLSAEFSLNPWLVDSSKRILERATQLKLR